MQKKLSDRINRIYRFLLRPRKTLSNFNPLPAETDDSVRQVFGLCLSLPASRWKGTKIKVIRSVGHADLNKGSPLGNRLILSKIVFEF